MGGESTGQVTDEVLKLSDIARRPKNRQPRRLEVLEAQLLAEGQLNAILVRPRGKVPKGDPKPFATYELIGGDRRCAALERIADRSELVPGLEPGTVRATVFRADDGSASRKAAIDNLGREDPTPLEQGEVYVDMLETGACVSIEELALRVGKSPQYVSQRMSLTKLDERIRADLEDEQLDVGAAIAVAQMPAAVQAKIAPLIGKLAEKGRVTRSAVEGLIEQYTHELREAPFDKTDPNLLPEAGACTTCPKRTGVQGALLDIGDDQEDTCLDASCWKRKTDANWKQEADAAKGKVGLKVLTDAEAKKTVNHGRVLHQSSWVDPEERLYSEKLGGYVDVAKLVTPDMPRALVRDPSTGEAFNLVEKKSVLAAAASLAKKPAAKSAKPSAREGAYKSEQTKARDAALKNGRTHQVLLRIAADIVSAGRVTLPAVAHGLVLTIAQLVGEDAHRAVGKRRKLEPKKSTGAYGSGGEWSGAVEDLLASMAKQSTAKELSRPLLALGVELAVADRVHHHAHASMDVPDCLEFLGLDVKDAAKEAERLHREAKAAPAPKGGQKLGRNTMKQLRELAAKGNKDAQNAIVHATSKRAPKGARR